MIHGSQCEELISMQFESRLSLKGTGKIDFVKFPEECPYQQRLEKFMQKSQPERLCRKMF